MRMEHGKIAFVAAVLAWSSLADSAEMQLDSYLTDSMVIQRDKPVRIAGFADKGVTVTVAFAGQEKTGKAGDDGRWAVTLDPMEAAAEDRELRCRGAGGKGQVALRNVVVGDVWFVGRQTYVDISLGRTDEGRKAASEYKPVGEFRAMVIKTVSAKTPRLDLGKDATSGWAEVDGEMALGMSGAAFYLGKELVRELGVPVGIVDVNMNHHFGIGWLSAKALADSAVIHPDDQEITWLPEWMQQQAEERDSGKAQKDLDEYYRTRMKGQGVKPYLGLHPMNNPMYPSGCYNAVIHPLKNLAVKGILLQLGNDYPFIAYREVEKKGMATSKAGFDAGWHDNYLILKSGYRVTSVTLPYVPGDWRRTFGDDDLPIGLILPPSSDLDVYAAHNREIRELHRRTAENADGIGLIMPGNENIPCSGQPADDRLLAERCAKWVLGAVSGKAGVTATGPRLDRVEARLSKAVVHFKDGTADGLKATGNALDYFETAGPDRVFTPVTARIDGAAIELASKGPIQFVRYNWSEEPDQGLVNGAGLPALPFSTDKGWEFAWIPPPAQPKLPEEYSTTADKWSKSDVAIVNGQIANMAQGDSEPIPRRPGPLGVVASPFGPNIYVVETEPGSPSDGKLMPGDVIYGVNGRVFRDGPNIPDDEQYRDLADAITYSESEEGGGKLVLGVRRGMKLMDVELQLQVLGAYSSTTPYSCEKSEIIVKRAEAWFAGRYRPESGPATGGAGMLNTDLFFMLASGTPEHQGLVRRAIYGQIAKMKPGPVTQETVSKPWHTGYTSLLLGEYYHSTGDRNVLPYLKYQADLSAASQLKPPAETPATKEAAQSDMQVGGWRQNYPGTPNRWMSGYGLMPHAGMPCVMGMQFAKEAGLEVDELALRRGLRHFRDGRAEHAFVLYSYGSLQRPGPSAIDPEAEANGKLGSMNGKLGTAAALYTLVDDQGPRGICARTCVYSYNNTRHGHGGMFFNNFWTPVGAFAAGEKGFKHFMKGQRWWRELFRKHDGSFSQVGRGGIGVSYALPYVAPKKRLRILGATRSAFGVNPPEYLKPALEAHGKRDYARCESLVLKHLKENITPAEDVPVINHLLESVRVLRQSIAHDLDYTERMVREGKYYYASLELPQLKGVVAADNPRLQAIADVLEAPETAAVVAKERQALDAEHRKRVSERRRAAQTAKEENWDALIAEKGGKWQMKVVEDVSLAPDQWTEPEFDDRGWDEATVPTSWIMYHTALFRGEFNIADKPSVEGLRVRGNFFQQANVVVYLNGELVAKIDNIGRGGGNTIAELTDYALGLLKEGENTVAISSRHLRRWGSYRGTYKTAATVSFAIEARDQD